MGKMAEIQESIEELHSTADFLNGLADLLARTFSCDEETSEGKETERKETEGKDREADKPGEQALTLDSVRSILAEKSHQGYTAQVRDLIHKYGATRLSDVDPQKYEALVWDAKAISDTA